MSDLTDSERTMLELLRKLPGNKVVVNYMSTGPLSAEDMMQEVEHQTYIGRQFTLDFMTICLDMLTRKSATKP